MNDSKVYPHDSLKANILTRHDPTSERDDQFWRAVERYNERYDNSVYNRARASFKLAYSALYAPGADPLMVLDLTDDAAVMILDTALAICGSPYHDRKIEYPLTDEAIAFLALFVESPIGV